MSQHPGTVRVAAVQAAPVFLDAPATLERAATLVGRAAAMGASLVAFPEVFVPGYPDWVWLIPPGRGALLAELYREYVEAAVVADPDGLAPVCAAAAAAGVHVALGICERADPARDTLYNSLAYIGPDGRVLGCHRKLVPTGGERLIWARGDGSTLDVHDTAIGRIGGLICWENYMPLARFALYAEGLQIYLAPTWDRGDNWLATLRHIAREGRVAVVGCGSLLHRDDIPDRFAFKTLYGPDKDWIAPGDSAIIGPDGKTLAGPVREREEILVADLDPGQQRGRKWDFDVAGHYHRPDVFRLIVDRRPRPSLEDTRREEDGSLA